MEERYFYYDLVTYDVWGNAKDGFEVNDAFIAERDIVIAESYLETDAGVIKALRKLDLLKKGIKTKSLSVDGEKEHTLYINDVRQVAGGLCPVCELRCTKIV